jgi:hypothetical protein
VLDGLKPQWLHAGNPPQTGGLHESFGDLTAIFLALSQLDQCEAVVAQTKARLHDKTFLADIAEQFGLALGSTTGLRNADNDLTLSQAGTEVHAISQVFTGAVYDILADVANEMLRIAAEDGKPQAVVNAIRDRFAQREVFAVPAGFTGDHPAGVRLAPLVTDAPGARQDRRACCGTMNLAEYYNVERVLQAEADALARWCAEHGRSGPAGEQTAKVALTTVTVTDDSGAAVATTAVVDLAATDRLR